DHLVNNAGIASLCTFEEAPDITTYRPIMFTQLIMRFLTLERAKARLWVFLPLQDGRPFQDCAFTVYKVNQRLLICFMLAVTYWWLQASKATLINFYECLRVELSPDVSVTIVTSADIELEMFKGRVLSKDGKMIMDPELQNVQVGMGFIYEKSAEDCAKDIVKGICEGNRYINPIGLR
ncbi:hypothetical protein GIB67_026110, partial [Kingdonia uniflora]